MTEFEMKLFKDLQNGKTMDEITAEFAKHLSAAEAEHKAIEEKKAAAKAEEEAKARAELEKAGTAIAELANRMLNGELTAEDVEWVITFSRVFSNTTIQKHQFLGAQPSSQSNSHIHT